MTRGRQQTGNAALGVKRQGADATQRLDKWLWYSRVVKSRTLAVTGIERGKVKVNLGRVSKPSQIVKVGDVVTVTLSRKVRVLKVVAPGRRRGSAVEAQMLFEELTPVTVQPTSDGSRAGQPGKGVASARNGLKVGRPAGTGRPTKRERRLTDRLKGGVDRE